MPQRVMNVVPTPQEEIDKEEKAQLDRAAGFPVRVVLPFIPPVLDQQGGTCVAHGAYVLYQQLYKTKYGHFAPITERGVLAFYDLMKKVENDPDPNRTHGAYLVTAMRVMAGSGFPFDNGTRGPKITGFHYVGNKAHDGRLALAQYRTPVLMGTGWDANWFYLPRTHILKAPVGQLVGGHAMGEIGYDLNVMPQLGGTDIDQNSWDGWCADGFGRCYFPESYKDRPDSWYEVWQATGIN